MATPRLKSAALSFDRTPRMASELVRVSRPRRGDTRGRNRPPQPVQQPLGAEGARREDDVPGGQGPYAATRACAGAYRGDGPALTVRGDVGDRAQGQHLGAGAFGQAQIVLGQGVLRVVPAARHARAAVQTGVAVRPRAAEPGVRDAGAGCRAGRPEVHADRHGPEGVRAAEVVRGVLEEPVGVGEQGVVGDAEHAAGLGVVGREFAAPVGDGGPRRALVEGLGRLVERVGVAEGAAADARAGEDEDVAEQRHAQDARAAEAGAKR